MQLTKEEKALYNNGLKDDYEGSEGEWWHVHHKILRGGTKLISPKIKANFL